MKDLKNKCAVITGAASGIGQAVATHASVNGMNVIMTDVNEAALTTAANTINQSPLNTGQINSFVADISKAEEVHALQQFTSEQFGDVCLLVNCAGVLINKFLWEHTSDNWAFLHGINIGGVCNTISEFVPHMIASQNEAWIVNIGSIASFFPSPLLGSYSSSKAAVLSISETLKYELDSIKAPIGVSFVAPGPVKTAIMKPENPIVTDNESETGSAMRAQMSNALDQIGMEPAEVATMIFDAINKQQFWVFPHPTMMEGLTTRSDDILNLVNPEYQVDF